MEARPAVVVAGAVAEEAVALVAAHVAVGADLEALRLRKRTPPSTKRKRSVGIYQKNRAAKQRGTRPRCEEGQGRTVKRDKALSPPPPPPYTHPPTRPSSILSSVLGSMCAPRSQALPRPPFAPRTWQSPQGRRPCIWHSWHGLTVAVCGTSICTVLFTNAPPYADAALTSQTGGGGPFSGPSTGVPPCDERKGGRGRVSLPIEQQRVVHRLLGTDPGRSRPPTARCGSRGRCRAGRGRRSLA